MVPHLRTALTQQLESPKQHQTFLRQFDSFVQDCIDHRQKIFDKLFDIMTDVLENHSRSIMSFNWNALGEQDKGPLFELTLDLARLQKAVRDYLEKHIDDLRNFFGRVLKMYVERLCSCMKTLCAGQQGGTPAALNAKGRAALKREILVVRTNMEKWIRQCDINANEVNVFAMEDVLNK